MGEGGVSRTRTLLDKSPGRLRLTYVDSSRDYAPGTVHANLPDADRGVVIDVGLPMVLTEARAQTLANHLLAKSAEVEGAVAALGPEGSILEAGDRISVEGINGTWQIIDVNDSGTVDFRLGSVSETVLSVVRSAESLPRTDFVPLAARPQLLMLDVPPLPGSEAQGNPVVAVFGSPWARPVEVLAGPAAENLTRRALVSDPAGVGQLVAPVHDGPLGRWDYGGSLELEIVGEILPSLSDLAVLNGAGLILVENDQRWELAAYRDAELISENRYRLRTLLRGLRGTAIRSASPGARCVLVDHRLQRGVLDSDEIGLELTWQSRGAGGTGDPVPYMYENKTSLPFAPRKLRRAKTDGADQLVWIRRAAEIGDGWRDEAWPNTGHFRVRLARNGETVLTEDVLVPIWQVASDSQPGDIVEIREIGDDGRIGSATSITL
ncbi:MAG: phage tail protein [Pseudomonadota bacterium]